MKIAETAALEVDGVIARSGQGLLGGRGTPHALAEMHEPATFSISIAVLWPSPITKVCNDVRAHVTGRVQELTGITPTRVDVDVAELVARSSLRSHTGPE